MNSAQNAVKIMDMGEHIVGVNHVGAPTLRSQSRRQFAPEKVFDRVDTALLPRDLRDVACRLNSQHGNCVGSIILEKVAVVARNLDDKTAAMPVAVGDHSLGYLFRMREEGVGKGGAINIVAKQNFRRDRNRKLNQRARFASNDRKRIARLGFP